MALVIADRVVETSASTGIGPSVSLLGAEVGFRTFASVAGVGDTFPYAIVAVDQYGSPTGEWETGLGTMGAGGTTFTRTTVYASSNSGAAVNFSAGTKRVFLTLTMGVTVTTNNVATLANKTISGESNTITNISLTSGVTGILPAANGGTGQSTYAVGDLLYASTTSALSKLAGVATGNALISGGPDTAPSWGKISLTTHVSGTLPVANGGTNASVAGIAAFNNITGYTAAGATGTTSTNLVFSTSPTLTTPTLNSAVVNTSPAVTAGTNAQGQGALTTDFNVITTAGSNPSGVTLPTATTGRRVVVVNKGANPINVYPASSAYIDALAINTSIQIPVGGVMEFRASSTTQWYSSANQLATMTYVTGTLAVANGGTGATTLTGILKGNGTSAFTAAVAGTDYAGLAVNNVFGHASGQTFLASATTTQDGVVINGRAGGTNSYRVTLAPTTLTASRSITLPDAAGTVVLDTGTQTLYGKTIASAVFTNGYTEETATANTGTAYTIDLANGTVQILTLTGNCTYTFPTASVGQSFLLVQKQDATGSRTATWPASVKWPSSISPTLTATASKADVFAFTADGTNWFGRVVGQNYL